MKETISVTATGDLFFGVDARHIRQLGQELVGDLATAVTELIKNAYDADATEVELRFLDAVDGPGGVLEVRDNGNGMTLDDVTNGWMRISTATKEDEPVSPRFGRTRAGRKGIGRFATETLGRRLHLWTAALGEENALVIEFNWTTAYASGTELSSVANPYRIDPSDGEHGTVLRIEDLYQAWDGALRERVKKAVRLLQPPFPVMPVQQPAARTGTYKPDPGFSVLVTIDGERDSLTIDGYDEFLGAATARLKGQVTPEGLLVVEASSQVLDLHVSEQLPSNFPAVGPLNVEAAYFIYRRETIGSVGVRIAQAMADQYAGIRLYRDGLRVMPYGERDNDWLGLDELSSSRSGVLVPVANRNWFGQVAISRLTNPQLIDTASREGVVDSEGFTQLRAAVRQALEWTAIQVATIRHRKVTTGDRPAVQSRRDVLERAAEEIVQAAAAELTPEAAARVKDLVDRVLDLSRADARHADEGEQERVESLLGELELLRILASLGTSIAVFSHEVRTALNTAKGALEVLEHGPTTPEISATMSDARLAVGDISDLATYIDAYVSASRRREREPQPLHAVISDFVERISKNVARNVEFEWWVEPSNLRTEPMARSELEAALINLLTNAIKAMDSEEHEGRRVSISAGADNTQIALRFQDSGSGVKPEVADRIFDAFFTDTKSTVSELGLGTGLGLKIVWDIAEANGGTISLDDADPGYTTCFELRLPRWHKQLDLG